MAFTKQRIEETNLKFSNKKFLITGGAGFIGSAIARRLFSKNSQIVILDNFSSGQSENITFQCEVVKGNVANASSLKEVHDIDFILHFGAPSSVVLFDRKPRECMTQSITGIRRIFEYAKNTGVKKVIYPSSSSVYGNTPLPQSEITPTKPTNLYGIAKLACEHIAKLYCDTVPNVGFRIFAGYGPGEGHKAEIASVITLFYNAISNNSEPIIFGDGSQSRDFIYIDDVIKVILRSLENSFTGIVNLGSGKSHTFNEVVDLINYLLQKDIHPRYVEKPAHYFEHTLADITKMKNIFKITPTGLEDGLQRYLEVKGEILGK